MITGKVVRFDEVKGYGFVAPDNGGEDVFLHVNDLAVDKRLIRPGVLVEFEVEEGERGLKASRVQLLHRSVAPFDASVVTDASRSSSSGDDGLCDVLTTREFLNEVTETLIHVAPTITVEELRNIREGLVQVAHAHGWVES